MIARQRGLHAAVWTCQESCPDCSTSDWTVRHDPQKRMSCLGLCAVQEPVAGGYSAQCSLGECLLNMYACTHFVFLTRRLLPKISRFFFFFKKWLFSGRVSYMAPVGLGWNLLCRLGQDQTHRELPAFFKLKAVFVCVFMCECPQRPRRAQAALQGSCRRL